MRCPYCAKMSNHVVDSRLSKDGASIRRRRECGLCERRFTTYERVDEMLPVLVKKDGAREPFSRQKLVGGIKKACEKRPVPMDKIDSFATQLEQKLQELPSREIASEVVGGEVMDFLRAADQVAYVRFASVYRSFTDIGEFMDELSDLIQERRASGTTKKEKGKGKGKGKGSRSD